MKRRTVLGLGGALVAAALLPGPEADMPLRSRRTRSTGRLLFSDEFLGPAGSPPDPAKWEHEVGRGIGMSGELQTYVNSRANSYLDGAGHLVIAATRNGGGYDSARITTQRSFSHLGGVWQARLKLMPRQGCWPAFWLLGRDFPQAGWPACGELDLMENYGAAGTDSSVHVAARDGSDFAWPGGVLCDDDWHVWQLNWDAGFMRFSRDGTTYLAVHRSQLPSWPFGPQPPNNGGCFMILNMAIGAGLGPPPASVGFPVSMLADYVRVWA